MQLAPSIQLGYLEMPSSQGKDDTVTVTLGNIIETELVKRKNENPEIRLNLNADEKVNYGVIAKVMAAIERAGIDRLSFISEHETN